MIQIGKISFAKVNEFIERKTHFYGTITSVLLVFLLVVETKNLFE